MIQHRFASSSVLLLAMTLLGVARADAPAGRYTISKMTVYDTRTKLTWQRASAPLQLYWPEANQYCRALDAEGRGFRLPTIKELLTIVDVTATQSPPVDKTAFPDTRVAPYWSSTPLGRGSTQYWTVYFDIGSTNFTFQGENAVRCVR